ncbi:transmembrane protein 179 [Centruroides vittatus]|uniref:transmembrane protein 179 n=1 Tax=Centruroides vittatus TaxID=120091 RepID=UPI00351027AB
MGRGNFLLLSQTTGYVVAFILSLCLVVPLSINLDNFKEHCLLYTTGTFQDDGNFKPEWASTSYCYYTMLVGIILLLTSIIQTIRMSVFLFRGIDSSFLSAFLDTVDNLLLTALSLIAAIIVTGGFKKWCDAVTERFASCDNASIMDIDKDDDIRTAGFYIQMGTVQFAIWSSWVCWVFLTVLSTCKLCRYHEQENVIVSMARERQRIISSSNSGPLYTLPDV